MKPVRVLPLLLPLLLTGSALLAHTEESVWFDGQSRSFFSRDALGEMDRPDTTSPRNLSEGYNLLDLNTHIEPADNLEVFAQLRVRNSSDLIPFFAHPIVRADCSCGTK